MIFSLTKGSWLLKSLKVRTTNFAGETRSLFLSFLIARVLLNCLKGIFLNFLIPPDPRCLIFRPISRGTGSCKLVSPDKPVSYGSIREAFRQDLKGIGPDPSKFGLHFLRSGGAIMAANNGVSDRVFQRHGRWRSVQARNLYVEDDLHQGLAVSKFLGL